jgi:spore maturation protein CgeB
MKLVIFGLTVSSSWGNGHATLWRGLISALTDRGHRVVFFERDQPFYASHRDLLELPPGAQLIISASWDEALPLAKLHLRDADAGMVTSYCADGVEAGRLLLNSRVPVKSFYDMDTPVTLERAERGESIEYIGPEGLGGYDVVLSYTGGEALAGLRRLFGARNALPLYGSVDPRMHYPVDGKPHYQGDISYLGTYAANRQEALDRLFLEPARRMPERRFVIGGAQYPQDFAWTPNLYFVQHLPPVEHPAFYCSSSLTLNVTRAPMAAMGWCPSGRLFEAAACGTPVLSDAWEGLDSFFRPGEEILIARSTEDAVEALSRSPEDLARMGQRARERALTEHTAARRAEELVAVLDGGRVSNHARN